MGLNSMPEGSEVDFAALYEARALHKTKYDLNKVVGSPEPLTTKGLTVKAHAFTGAAVAMDDAHVHVCVICVVCVVRALHCCSGSSMVVLVPSSQCHTLGVKSSSAPPVGTSSSPLL